MARERSRQPDPCGRRAPRPGRAPGHVFSRLAQPAWHVFQPGRPGPASNLVRADRPQPLFRPERVSALPALCQVDAGRPPALGATVLPAPDSADRSRLLGLPGDTRADRTDHHPISCRRADPFRIHLQLRARLGLLDQRCLLDDGGRGPVLRAPPIAGFGRLLVVAAMVVALVLALWTSLFNLTAGRNAIYGYLYAILVFGVLLGSPALRRVFEFPAIRFVGLISYSLYLWHTIVLGVFVPSLGQYSPPLRVLIGFALLAVSSIPVAYLSYMLAERPFLYLRRQAPDG